MDKILEQAWAAYLNCSRFVNNPERWPDDQGAFEYLRERAGR